MKALDETKSLDALGGGEDPDPVVSRVRTCDARSSPRDLRKKLTEIDESSTTACARVSCSSESVEALGRADRIRRSDARATRAPHRRSTSSIFALPRIIELR